MRPSFPTIVTSTPFRLNKINSQTSWQFLIRAESALVEYVRNPSWNTKIALSSLVLDSLLIFCFCALVTCSLNVGVSIYRSLDIALPIVLYYRMVPEVCNTFGDLFLANLHVRSHRSLIIDVSRELTRNPILDWRFKFKT